MNLFKRWIDIALLLALFGAGTPVSAAAQDALLDPQNAGVELHSGQAKHSSVIRRPAPDQSIKFIQRQEDWFRVRTLARILHEAFYCERRKHGIFGFLTQTENRQPASSGVRYKDESLGSVQRQDLDQRTRRIHQAGQANILHKDQNASVELTGQEPERPPEKPVEAPEPLLNRAWALYEAKDYENARSLFSQAAGTDDARTRLEALFGLSLSLEKMGRDTQAVPILEELVEKDYRLPETVSALIRAHMRRGNLNQASRLVPRLPPAERTALLKELDSRKEQKGLNRIRRATDGQTLIRAVRSNERLLEQCRNTQTFLQAARRLAEMGETEAAVSLFRRLLPCTPAEGDTRIQIIQNLTRFLPFAEARVLIHEEKEQAPKGSGYRKNLKALEVNLLKERLAALPSSSPEYQALAREILRINPKEEGIRAGLAWACYNANNTACAREQFRLLHQNDPDHKEYLAGLCRSLIRAGRPDEAAALLQKNGLPQDPELHSLRLEALKQAGIKAFEEKDYARAEKYLDAAGRLSPDDPDIINLLAWSRYHLKDYSGARELFLRSFRKRRAPEDAANVLLACDGLHDKKGASRFTDMLAAEPDPGLRKIAADRYYKEGRSVLAARTDPGGSACYTNCDTPWMEAFSYYWARTGDAGLSRLSELAFPLRLNLPVKRSGQWSFTLKPAYLDAGHAPQVPYAGSYYQTINAPGAKAHAFKDSAWVFTPEIRFVKQGPVNYEVRAGSTPVGTPVEPLPTFLAGLFRKNDGFLNVHQCAVKESLLSYGGRQDPYADRTWGRVLKTGTRAGKTVLRRVPYWASLEAGYDYLWGKKTVDNHKVFGTASAGRTAPFHKGELSLGVFGTAQHFERNTGFYTFGHGGYFSPEVYVMAGPFAHFVTKGCSGFWFDAQVSAGYVYYETEDAPQYYKTGEDGSALTAAARGNLMSVYKGETKSSFGISARIQGLKLVDEHWALGGFAGVNTTSDHTEYQAGLALRYFFNARNVLCFTDDFFAEAMPCD